MLGSTTVPTAAHLCPLLTYVLLHCRTAALLLYCFFSITYKGYSINLFFPPYRPATKKTSGVVPLVMYDAIGIHMAFISAFSVGCGGYSEHNPGRIGPRPRFEMPPYHCNSDIQGMEYGSLQVGSAPKDVETPINRHLAFIPAFSEPQSHWSMVPAPSALGQSENEARAGGVAARDNAPPSPVAPGEGFAPSPAHNSLYISTTLMPGGRKSGSPGSTPPRTVWKPQSYGSIADGLQRVKSAPPEEYRAQCLDRGSYIPLCLYNSNTPKTKTMLSRTDTDSHGVKTPTPLAGH